MTFSHNPADTPSEGTVELQHWHQVPFAERDIRGVIGKVSVHSAQSMLGFDVNAKDSNWIACIEGDSGLRVYFPGCQVAGITYAPETGGKMPCTNPNFVRVP